MDYPELINSATQSDKQALDDLLELAEKLSVENKYEESTKVFRDSTIFNRIAANTSAITKPDNIEAYELNERCKLIKRWIEAHPTGISPLPRIVEGLTPWFIFCTVDYEIFHEEDKGESWPLTPLIESSIYGSSGVPNNYAGATVPSLAVHTMEDYFGLSPNISATFGPPEARMHYYQMAATALEKLNGLPLEVRIWVDLLADEVERQFQASKAKNSPPT